MNDINGSFSLSLFPLSSLLSFCLFCSVYFHVRGYSHISVDAWRLFVFKRGRLKSARSSRGLVEWTETWMVG